MSRTEDLLDKAVLLGLLADQYSEQFYTEALILYRLMVRRVGRILRPEYGRSLTMAEKRVIITDLDEEIDRYRDSLRSLAQDQLREASDAVYDAQQTFTAEVDSDLAFSDRPNLSRGLFSRYHPIEDGRVIQLDAMYVTHIDVLRRSLQDVVNRLGTIVEERSVAEGYFLSATERNQHNLNSVSLTSVALAASLAKQAFYTRNQRLFSGYQWVSILDSRTSAYCQERHLKVWYYDDPERSTLASEEHPPGHFRCRSQTTPIFRNDVPVQSPTFVEWFERQSDATKRDILGKHRYDMYRSGMITIDDVNTVRGNRRTLAELRAVSRS